MTMPNGASPSATDAARRAVRLSAVVVLLLVTAGGFAIYLIRRGSLERNSMFYEQFAAIEWPGLALLAAFAIAVLVLLRRDSIDSVDSTPKWLTGDSRVLI